MCGIVGYSGTTEFDEDKIKFLLYYNSIERTSNQGTGIWSKKQGVVKLPDSCKTFLKNVEILPCKEFIGHVRSRSIGIVSADNTHPFEYGTLIGCQNGTLANYEEMADKYKIDLHTHSTDSRVLFKALSETKDFTPISEIDGPTALLWKNTATDLLYVFRNFSRTLYRGKIEGASYISSEREALAIIGCKTIYEFKEDCVYRIKNGEIVSNVIKIKNTPIAVVNKYSTYSNTRPEFKNAASWHDIDAQYLDNVFLYHITKQDWHKVFSVRSTNIAGVPSYNLVKMWDSHNNNNGYIQLDKQEFLLTSLPEKLKYAKLSRDIYRMTSNFSIYSKESEKELIGKKGEVVEIIGRELYDFKIKTYITSRIVTISPVNTLIPCSVDEYNSFIENLEEDIEKSLETKRQEEESMEDLITAIQEYIIKIRDAAENYDMMELERTINELEQEVAQYVAESSKTE